MPKRKSRLPYNPALRARARALRKDGTLGEVLLWREIQNKALGWEFHRQVPIDNYIVDFFCHELMFAIEVDGSSHDDPDTYLYDQRRQKELESLGVHFLRFTEGEVRQDPVHAAEAIRVWIENNLVSHPPLD